MKKIITILVLLTWCSLSFAEINPQIVNFNPAIIEPATYALGLGILSMMSVLYGEKARRRKKINLRRRKKYRLSQ